MPFHLYSPREQFGVRDRISRVCFLPNRAISMQHGIDCVWVAIHALVLLRFYVLTSIFFGMPCYRQKRLWCILSSDWSWQCLWIEIEMSCTPAWVVSHLIGSRSRARHENWKRIFEIPYCRTIREIPLNVSETYCLDHSRTCLACILHTSDFLKCWRNGEKNPFFNSRIPNVFGKFDNAIGKKFIESMNLTLEISRLKILAPFTICEISHVLLV